MVPARFWLLTGMVVAAVASRWMPLPPNFAPIGAMALFAGAHFSDRRLALLIPFVAMLLSDAVIGFHPGIPFVYGCFAANVVIGMGIKSRRSLVTVPLASVACSLLFFLVTNFAFWPTYNLYPKTFEGLIACYTAALPYFGNTLLGDLCFSAVLFGGFALAERKFASLRESAGAAA